MKKLTISVALILGMISQYMVSASAAQNVTQNTSVKSLTNSASASASASAEDMLKLPQRQWDNFNRQRLDDLLAKARKYAPHTFYAVFDFDNTTAFLDIEEAILVYQLKNLLFAMSPTELDQVIRKNIPETDFIAEFNNKDNETVNIKKISSDILLSYQWIYDNFDGLNGDKSFSEIIKSPHYINFITKVRYLYAAIGGSFQHEVSYPWVTYLFKNMTAAQVADITRKTIEWQNSEPIKAVTWESPASLPGKAGVLNVTWQSGFRLVPEMQDLYSQLQNAGVDVYVISASNLEVIQSVVTKPPYSVPESQVFAMRLQRTEEGKLTENLDPFYPQTQGKGKTETIRKFIQNRYEGKGPLLVAGDSEGDQNMMSDFTDTESVLIINRLRSPESVIGKLSAQAVKEYGQNNAKILLQGRNENTGYFITSQMNVPLGENSGKVVK